MLLLEKKPPYGEGKFALDWLAEAVPLAVAF